MKKILLFAFFALLASFTDAQTFTFECYCGDLSGVRCDICTGQTQTRFFCGLLVKKSGTVVKWIDAPYLIQWQGNNAIIKEIIPNPESITINLSGTSFANLAAFKAALECPCNVPGKLFYISDSLRTTKVMRNDTVTMVGRGGASILLDTTNQKFIVTAATGAAQVLSATGAGPTRYNIALSGGGGAAVLKEGTTGIDLSRSNDTITINNTAPDQTVSITGGGINVVAGTYPNFTITGTEVDGNTANEGVLGVGAGSATSSVLLSNTTGASGVTINAAGINTISETTSANGGQITITATEVDGSTTNEIQTIANTSDATSHTATLSSSGGSVKLVEGSNISLTTTGTGSDGIVTIAATGGGVTSLNSLTGALSILGERGITIGASTPNITVGLPTSTNTHTLRYDGTNWITNSQITNNGNEIGIGGAPLSGFEAYINGATRMDGAMVSRGAGNPVSGITSPHARLWNTTLSTGDTWYLASLDTGAFHLISGNLGASVLMATTAGQVQTNAGLRIGSVSGTPTSIIGRNASGDVGAISIGSGLTLSGGSLSAAAGSSNWTVSGSDIYRLSNVSVGTTTATGAKLQVTDATDADIILATDGTLVSGDAFFRTSGTLGTTGGFTYAFDGSVSATGSNVISRTFNTSTTNAASNAIRQVIVGGGSAGDPISQYIVNGATTWTTGIDNSVSGDPFKLSASTVPGTSDVMEIATGGYFGFSTTPATDLTARWGLAIPFGLPTGGTANRHTSSIAGIWGNSDLNRIEAKTAAGTTYKTLLSYATPTATKQAAAGSTGTATLATNSNDKAGQVTIVVSGTGITSGPLVNITYSGSMLGTPFVTLTARNGPAAGQMTNFFIGSQSSTVFSIDANTAPAAGTYILNYSVQQ